jgi:nucleotide-binding universal stress UspA family protein
MFAKVLVPVDGSPDAHRALDTALDLAGRLGARVTVLEVVEDFGPLPGYYEAAPEGADRVRWLADQRFEDIVPALGTTDVAWDRLVERGDPADTVCRVAEQEAYDLIVIGSRGLSAVKRFLVGSVSDRVVHHAPCPVLVVR